MNIYTISLLLLQTSNPAWAPTLFFHSPFPERPKDMSGKNWTQLAGSGPVPWRQAPSLFNTSISSPDLHTRVPYGIDGSMGINKLNAGERISVHPLEKKKAEDFSERLMKVNLAIGTPVTFENGNSGSASVFRSLKIQTCLLGMFISSLSYGLMADCCEYLCCRK